MSDILNWFLYAIGHRQAWHVSWTAHLDNGVVARGDGTYIIRPRLTVTDMKNMRAFFANEAVKVLNREVGPEHVRIVSLTRIGR